MGTFGHDSYADILHLPHHVSRRFPQMSMDDRAAQFGAFDALSGFTATIQETARRTMAMTERLDEAQA